MADGSCPGAARHVLAYGDASVQDIKACPREAGFTGTTSQSPLLTYMTIKSRLQGVALKFDTRDIKEKGKHASDSIGTLHFSHWVPFGKDHIGFFTIFDGDMATYFQDFADKTSFVFDSVFPHVGEARRQRPSRRTRRPSISGA